MDITCFFAACKQPVTHVVHQLWNGKTVHCCDQHKPGSKARPADTPDRFYRVEKLTDAA